MMKYYDDTIGYDEINNDMVLWWYGENMVVSAGLALKVAVLSLHGNPRTSNFGALSALLSLHTVHIFHRAPEP